MKPPKMKIVRTINQAMPHRSDFETCPECDHQMKHEEWDKCRVEFFLGIHHGKHGSGVEIAECPKCFKKSWVHFRLDGFNWDESIPQPIRDASDVELARRRLAALRDWGACICWNCKNLHSGTVDTNAYRHCVIGCGGPEKECKRFEPIKA